MKQYIQNRPAKSMRYLLFKTEEEAYTTENRECIVNYILKKYRQNRSGIGSSNQIVGKCTLN